MGTSGELKESSKGSEVSLHGHEEEDEEATRMILMEVMMMCAVPYALKAATTVGVPKILLDAGRGKTLSAEKIASLIPVSENGSPADAKNLERILRLLASHGLIKEVSFEAKDGIVERRYGATVAMRYLFVDDENVVGKDESLVLLLKNILGNNNSYDSVHLSVFEKSKEAFALVHGKSLWELYAADPAARDQFNRSMANHSTFFSKLILDKYDGYKTVTTLVDVGGGLGVNVAAVVAKYPNIRGINFDLPHVVSSAPKFPGVEHVGGDFWESIPECDAVFMKWILHNWDDEHCVKILKNIEKALPEHGKIINVDAVLPETQELTCAAKTIFAFDWMMLAMCVGGKERTLSEFRQLGAAAGFSRVDIATTVDQMCVLEFYKK